MKGKTFFTPSLGALIVWLLALAGVAGIVYRFWAGLGAVTNLNDGYPWGLWVAVDIMSGVALASGGFVVAGAAHLLGGRQFEALARPAILTALLGYVMFVLGLLVDMGRPWHMLHLYAGNHGSPMYEIGWCGTLYTLVLCLELLPAVLEKYSMKKALDLWRSWSPWLVVALLAVFTYAMTYSLVWSLVVAGVFVAWELSMRAGKARREVQVPVLLIGAGVILSFLHQSSLGVLFLMAPHTLNPLWHTPLLPVLFLVSAVGAGVGMMTLESLGSERFMGRPAPLASLTSFARQMPLILAAYLALKIGDLFWFGDQSLVFSGGSGAAMWWVEIMVGVVLPLVLYLVPGFIRNRRGLFFASLFVVAGVVINRINVAMVGVVVKRWAPYHPSWMEFTITLGIIAMGLLAYDWLSDELPIHQKA